MGFAFAPLCYLFPLLAWMARAGVYRGKAEQIIPHEAHGIQAGLKCGQTFKLTIAEDQNFVFEYTSFDELEQSQYAGEDNTGCLKDGKFVWDDGKKPRGVPLDLEFTSEGQIHVSASASAGGYAKIGI